MGVSGNEHGGVACVRGPDFASTVAQDPSFPSLNGAADRDGHDLREGAGWKDLAIRGGWESV